MKTAIFAIRHIIFPSRIPARRIASVFIMGQLAGEL